MITQQPVGGTLNENGFLYIYVVMSKEEEDNWPFKYILYKDGSEYSTKITDNTLGRVKVEEPGEYYFQIIHQDRMAFSDKVIVTAPSD